MPDRQGIRDWFRQNTAIGAFSNGRPGAGAASAIGSALGGPLLGYAAGKIANKWYDRRDRNNYVPSSPQPQTPDNNAGLAMGMTDWGAPNAFGGSQAQGSATGPFSGAQAGGSAGQGAFAGSQASGSTSGPPLMGGGGKSGNGQSTGGGIGFGWGASQDSFDQGMIMDALGMSGALGGGGPNIDSPYTWMRRAVK